MDKELQQDYTEGAPHPLSMIDEHELAESIAWLLFRSDWYKMYAIPEQDVITTAARVAGYALGADDGEFSYAAEGRANRDYLSDFLSREELELRCMAMCPSASLKEKIAAAILYFRYCYDHNEFVELRSLAQLAPSAEDESVELFLQQLCPIFLALEKRYQESL